MRTAFNTVIFVISVAISSAACSQPADPGGTDGAPGGADSAVTPRADAAPIQGLNIQALDRYVSLGDSMSEHASARQFPKLLYRNDDARFPEWAGKDLVSRFPGIQHIHRASGGDVVAEVLDNQIPGLEPHDGPVLVTLTIGGNDFKKNRGSVMSETLSLPLADAFETDLELVISRLEALYTGDLYIFVATIHDPSDEEGRVYDRSGLDEDENVCALMFLIEDLGLWEVTLSNLAYWNGKYPTVAAHHDSTYVAELHDRFLGHGVNATQSGIQHYDAQDPTTWLQSDCVHPNDRGDSEIRRLMWQMTE